MIVKNYKELCSLLEVPVKAGNSKKTQMKDLETKVKFHKEGNKFVIDDIYKTELIRTDKRVELPYKDEVRAIILGFILNNIGTQWCEKHEDGSYTTYITNNRFRNVFNLYNDHNMRLAKTDSESFSNIIECDEKELKKMISNYKSQDKYLIESSLKFLKNRSLIVWNPTKIILKKTAYAKMNDLMELKVDLNNNVDVEIDTEWKEITWEEDAMLTFIKRELLNKYNAKEEWDLLMKGKVNEFYSELKTILEDKMNIVDFYSVNKITFDEEVINEYFKRFGGLEELNIIREELSNKVVNHRLKTANNKYHSDPEKIVQLSNIHNSLKRGSENIKINNVKKENIDIENMLEEIA